MDSSIKNLFYDAIFRVYYPLCKKKKKYRAIRMWYDGVKQCKQLYNDIGAPRCYLFFDAKNMIWAPMTYEPNKKLKPSLRQLRWMGKLRGKNLPTNVASMKQHSYYYTASRWGAKAVDDVPKLKERKLKLWITYYLSAISVPMKKCLEYRQGYLSRHHQTV